jgi:hypothetical protein
MSAAARSRVHHSSSTSSLGSSRPSRALREVKSNHFLNNCVEELCEMAISHVSNMHGGDSGGDELPAQAKAYLDLLRESSNSQLSIHRHLVMLASKSSFIEMNNHFKNATTATKLLTDPIECLAQVLGDATSSIAIASDSKRTGKQLWAKLRSTFTAAAAFSSSLKTRDDSHIGMASSLSLNPLQKKFMQLVVGGVVSNLVVGTLSSATGGGMDAVELTSHITTAAAHISDTIPGLHNMIQDVSGIGDVAENATKVIGVVQAAAQTMMTRAASSNVTI